MQLSSLFVSQRGLRRAGQIPALVEAILNGEPIPPIRLSEDDDGSIQVEDGHHRATACWLAGKFALRPQDYILFPVSDLPRHRLGTLRDFVHRHFPGSAQSHFQPCLSFSSHEHHPPQDQRS